MELSKQIKEARAKLGIPQKEASERWGIPMPTLKAYEQGKRTPRGLAMTKLREILDAALADKPAAPASSESPAPSPAPPKELRRRRPAKQSRPRRAKATTSRRASRA